MTMPRLAQEGQARAGHVHQAQHVGLPHRDPVVVVRLGDRRQPERAARVVDENVDVLVPLFDRAHEFLDAAPVRHVEAHGFARLADDRADSLHAPRPGDDVIATRSKRLRGRGSDAG